MVKEAKRKLLLITILIMIFSSSVVYASLISNVHAAELTSQQKALSTLSDVVGFDISKYNNIPVAYPNDFYRDTFPRENVRCNLDSADSNFVFMLNHLMPVF